jgi:hypothetical protein
MLYESRQKTSLYTRNKKETRLVVKFYKFMDILLWDSCANKALINKELL